MSRLRKAIKGILRYPADALLASSTRKPSVMEDPRLTAKFYPYKPELDSFLFLDNDRASQQGQGLPIPPRELWWGYGKTADEYVTSGKEHVATMLGILQKANFQLKGGQRILDYGCAGGRMIRHFADIPGQYEVWGTDISAEHITWCQQHLSPPFDFATTTTFPHLPFEDNSFDLIYCGSVFTHISDLAEAWLLELRRITRPGGMIYITIHDRHTIELLFDRQYVRNAPDGFRSSWEAFAEKLRAADNELKFSTTPYAMFTLERSPHGAQVFYDEEYLRRHWGRMLKFRSITPEAYGFQSAVLLEK